MSNVDSAGIDLIRAERERQVMDEGWTPEHDDAHADSELLAAARCYLTPRSERLMEGWAQVVEANTPVGVALVPETWPWEPEAWRPTDRMRELVKAGALIAAEIDRLRRHRAQQSNAEAVAERPEGEGVSPLPQNEYDNPQWLRKVIRDLLDYPNRPEAIDNARRATGRWRDIITMDAPGGGASPPTRDDMYSLAIGEAHRRADMEQQRDREAAERRREMKGWADAFNALKEEKDELRRQLSDCERGGRGEGDPSQARTVVLDPTNTGAEE